MNRRGLLAWLGGVCVLSFAKGAQSSERVYRIGLLSTTLPNDDLIGRQSSHPIPGLIENGLRELGWVHGKNVQLLWKSTEGRNELLPTLVDEFVRLPVDLLVAFNGFSAEAAFKRTRSVPIVAFTGNMVERGLVASLARPGRNLTGVSLEVRDLEGKLLQLLKRAAPQVTRVAFLAGAFIRKEGLYPETQRAAATLGLTIFVAPHEAEEQIESAIAEAVRQGANGLLVGPLPHMQLLRGQQKVHELSARYRLPAIHEVLAAVESGGLMGYAADHNALLRRIPYLIDKILRGAKPGELPIEQPTRFELHINLKTAKALGLTIPAAVVAEADRVFQ